MFNTKSANIMKNHFLCALLLGFTLLFTNCKENSPIRKIGKNDPFKSSLVDSQFFEIQSNSDNVVEGENGTVIIFPKGCFLDSNNNVVEESVKVELAEALSIEEMILSNLTTTSYGKLLETDGMIFVNATSNGEQLKIDPYNPIYVEIPTKKFKSGMMVYNGVRDESGNMDWINPKPIENSVVAVDVFSLDFLPKGFKEEVEVGLPFRNFKKPTAIVVDSLYYFLDAYHRDLANKFNTLTTYSNFPNEAYYNDFDSLLEFNINEPHRFAYDDSLDTLLSDFGVNPLKIKAIKTEAFQNTLIATREFEQRLQTIFKVCRPDIIDIYINNLDKNLWELDSIAAQVLIGDYFEDDFIAFKNQRKTKVKGVSKSAKLLKEYYKQRMLKVEAEKQQLFSALEKIRIEEQKKLKQLKKEYRVLLAKREKYRMQTYGFTQTTLGWINIDKGTIEKDWQSQPLQLVVENGARFDKVFTYVFYKSIKSLYRLNTMDNVTFFVGDSGTRQMLIPIEKPAVLVGVGYTDNKSYIGVLDFETGSAEEFTLSLKETSQNQMKRVLQQFETNGNENSILVDLNYSKKLTVGEKQKQKLVDAADFLNKLKSKSYPFLKSTMRYDQFYGIELQVDYCDPNPMEIIEETLPYEN